MLLASKEQVFILAPYSCPITHVFLIYFAQNITGFSINRFQVSVSKPVCKQVSEAASKPFLELVKKILILKHGQLLGNILV